MMVLPAPCIVGEQEAHAGQLEEVLVDRFELVRQRINARDGKPKIGIELVGDAERIGLEADSQKLSVAVVGKSRVGYGQVGNVSGRERDLTELLGPLADEARLQIISTVYANGHYSHRLAEQRASQYLSFANGGFNYHYGSVISLKSRSPDVMNGIPCGYSIARFLPFNGCHEAASRSLNGLRVRGGLSRASPIIGDSDNFRA